MKKILCMVVAAAMSVSLAACVRNEEDSLLASKDNIYASEDITLPDGVSNISFIGGGGEVIYLCGFYQDVPSVLVLDTAGNILDSRGKDGVTIQSAVIGADGYLRTIESDGEKTELIKNDERGGVLESVALNQTELGYISNFAVDEAGRVYIASSNMVYAFDGAGNLLFTIGEEQGGAQTGRGPQIGGASFIGGVYLAGNGEIVVHESKFSMEGGVMTTASNFNVIDAETGGYSKTYETAKTFSRISNGTDEYDLIVTDGATMSGYDLETDSLTVIIDWIQSGFDAGVIQSPALLSDRRILCASFGFGVMQMGGATVTVTSMGVGDARVRGGANSEITLTLFTKIDPADLPDKKLISLTALNIDNNLLRSAAVAFNKMNIEYQIEITSYTTDNDYMSAITKLNSDIISGKAPDILAVDSSLPFSDYISKGIIADLYGFMDGENGLNREDYLQNILDAYSVNGKLYSIVPSFSINTVIGRSSDIGDGLGWTMDEFLAFVAANPDENIFSEMTKSTFLSNALSLSMNGYVNRDAGTCSFDSQDFISLLEFANTFPAELDDSGNPFGAAFRAGGATDAMPAGGAVSFRNQRQGLDALLSRQNINRFISLREFEKAIFIEPITFVGFPVSAEVGGTGSTVNAYMELAVMANAKNPEGAWEFCKYLLSDKYQDDVGNAFPVKLSSLEKLAAAAQEKPFYMDGDTKVEYENLYFVDRTPIEIGVNDKSDTEKMMNFIKSVSRPYRNDQKLNNIIMEEADYYFAGQKTAAETAAVIQNRASTYLSERS